MGVENPISHFVKVYKFPILSDFKALLHSKYLRGQSLSHFPSILADVLTGFIYIYNMASTTDELRTQWANPGDVLSLLLLIGGDIVQKAVAQLIGYKIHLPGHNTLTFHITPIAFSFGWVAYGFLNLLSVMGDKRLMPVPDYPSVVVNCSNGFVREAQSWVLGRLLRDHEARFEVDTREPSDGGRGESIRIDIFTLGSTTAGPTRDLIWWFGWITIVAQICIALLPWILNDDWGIMMVVIVGNALAALTCTLPQWTQEKWAGRKLHGDKLTCLTRGNGSLHVMVFIGGEGSWDIESLAVGALVEGRYTRWASLLLAICWTCLLISVSGLKNHAWYLIGIGGLGMLQNIFAAGAFREPSASNFHMTKFSRAPTIIGKRHSYKDDEDAEVDLNEALSGLQELSEWASEKSRKEGHIDNVATNVLTSMPRWLSSMSVDDGTPPWLEAIQPILVNAGPDSKSMTSASAKHILDTNNSIIYAMGVHGALIELEKWVPTAGLAMMQIFFPSGLEYRDGNIRDNVHKKFWRRAYHTKSVRKMAEEKRREIERKAEVSMIESIVEVESVREPNTRDGMV